MKKIICLGLLVVAMLCVTGCFSRTATYSPYQKTYSKNELSMIMNDSFYTLNNINYPSFDLKQNLAISNSFKEAVLNFSYNVYNKLSMTNNRSFSPMGLYSLLSVASLATADAEIAQLFDQVLHLEKAERSLNYLKFYANNYFANDSGSVQMYNGVFATNRYDINDEFIEALTDYYCEAYAMNFTDYKDVAKMVDWVNERVKQQNFIKSSDLPIDEFTTMYIFNTLYFENKWQNKFSTLNTYKGKFYLQDGKYVSTDYMSHSYLGEVYDYDAYLSCYDYYANGYKVQYLITKDKNEDIFKLLENHNFLIEDEDRLILTPDDENELIISLKVPTFENNCLIDFKPILASSGLSIVFEENSHAFDGAFSNLDSDTSIYLKTLIQKNKISFTESGTVIYSTTLGGMNYSASAPRLYTIDINLDHPFIYVIYDESNIPLYIGAVNNPAA